MLKNRIITISFVALLAMVMYYDWQHHVSIGIYVALILIFLIIHTLGSIILSMRFFLPVLYRGNATSNAIAITFDDGPVAGNTEKILDILEHHQVHATFFCIGHRVDHNPALTKRIHDAGHLIGNHSYWHGKTFDLQSAEKIIKELEDTDLALKNAAGISPLFFRPPYGVTNPMVAKAVRRGAYKTIGWSIRSFDTINHDHEKLFKRVTKSIKGGDIILFHDYCNVTIDILPELLAHIAKLGLKVVRTDTLLNEEAYR